MWLLAIEAFLAFFIFAFIVWWTMFHGKKPAQKSKPKQRDEQDKTEK